MACFRRPLSCSVEGDVEGPTSTRSEVATRTGDRQRKRSKAARDSVQERTGFHLRARIRRPRSPRVGKRSSRCSRSTWFGRRSAQFHSSASRAAPTQSRGSHFERQGQGGQVGSGIGRCWGGGPHLSFPPRCAQAGAVSSSSPTCTATRRMDQDVRNEFPRFAMCARGPRQQSQRRRLSKRTTSKMASGGSLRFSRRKIRRQISSRLCHHPLRPWISRQSWQLRVCVQNLQRERDELRVELQSD